MYILKVQKEKIVWILVNGADLYLRTLPDALFLIAVELLNIGLCFAVDNNFVNCIIYFKICPVQSHLVGKKLQA